MSPRSGPTPDQGNGWLIAVRNGDELLRFDEHLNQLRSLSIPTFDSPPFGDPVR